MKYFSCVCICIFLGIGAFFTAKVPFNSSLWFVSALSIVLFAIPSYFFLKQSIGFSKTLYMLMLLGIFAFLLEYCAVKTGFPYGIFAYTTKIGYKIWGSVPWTVPFAYTPLLLGSYTISQKYFRAPLPLIMVSAFILVAIDMVIDPASVALQFWIWKGGGIFYGVPMSNFVGWFISGSIGSAYMYWILKKMKITAHLNEYIVSSMFLIIFFWTSVCFFQSLFISFVIGCILLIIITKNLLLRR